MYGHPKLGYMPNYKPEKVATVPSESVLFDDGASGHALQLKTESLIFTFSPACSALMSRVCEGCE